MEEFCQHKYYMCDNVAMYVCGGGGEGHIDQQPTQKNRTEEVQEGCHAIKFTTILCFMNVLDKIPLFCPNKKKHRKNCECCPVSLLIVR